MQISVGGWVFPWVFPWTFTPITGTPGTVQAYNTGSIEVGGTFHITGPCDVGIELRNLTTGAILQLNMPMQAADWVDIDMNNETVLFQSVSDRRNTIVQGTNFWKLLPGPNTVRLSSLGAIAATTGSLSYRSAYISLRA
jgi:hypothetical protein